MISKELLNDINEYAEANRDSIFRDIARLISINSVGGTAEDGAPFGKGPAAAMAEALKLSSELGLGVQDCEGKMGLAILPSEVNNDKYLAMISHLDVVPEGNGWDGNPFEMREKDGYIIGRGVYDDKGPAVIALYAMKYLKDRGIKLKYPIKTMLGVNEETGMGDLDYYLENYPAPVFCFSPDADFPLINGEKGLYGAMLTAVLPAEKIRAISGGVAFNAVPDLAEAIVECTETAAAGLSPAERIEVQAIQGGVRITAHGIAGHASTPEGTISAIGLLAHYLLDNSLVSDNDAKTLSLILKIQDSYDGSLLNIGAKDDAFGSLTIVGGVIGMDSMGRITQTIDSRFPTSITGEAISQALRQAAEGVAVLSDDRSKPPFYIDNSDPVIQVCINAYNDITGENASPFTIGGATYARAFPKAVGFGPIYSNRPLPEGLGSIHSANEAASKDDLIEAMKIYIVTLLELEKLDF